MFVLTVNLTYKWNEINDTLQERRACRPGILHQMLLFNLQTLRACGIRHFSFLKGLFISSIHLSAKYLPTFATFGICYWLNCLDSSYTALSRVLQPLGRLSPNE